MPKSRHLPPKTKRAVKKVVKQRMPKHHRFILHPLSIFVLLCLGVFFANWTIRAFSDSYSVNAINPAPPLPSGAYITGPTNNETFTTSPIDVSGTCPSQSYIKLFNNNIFVGTAWCSSGDFTIQTGLSVGLNSLVAQDYNVTNSPGPATPAVNVQFKPIVSPILPPSQVAVLQSKTGRNYVPPTPSPTAPPLLTTDYSLKAFSLNQPFRWTVKIIGGSAPYVLQIEWGDNVSSIIGSSSSGVVILSHKYAKQGYYPVEVKLVDNSGRQSYMQIAALIGTPQTLGLTSTCSINCAPKAGGLVLPGWVWLLWSSYIAVVIMAVSFYLGQREEYRLMLKRYPHLFQ